MVPRTDDRFDRSLRFHQHIRHVIAVAILESADQKTRNRDLAQRSYAIPPERPVMLMLQIQQRPGRGIEARTERLFVQRIIRSSHPAFRHIHVQFEFIYVRHPIYVMDVIVK